VVTGSVVKEHEGKRVEVDPLQVVCVRELTCACLCVTLCVCVCHNMCMCVTQSVRGQVRLSLGVVCPAVGCILMNRLQELFCSLCARCMS
jgi:hypothetical protein